ncbi:methyl-accepting chemotaxis protein, partial [Cronobacter dublinensis]|nr:methyl-accepting chemotaxis protein [Cronobacter dublinensis]
QQNASLVQQSAAAAGALEDQASRLSQAVAAFRLAATRASARPAPVAARAEPVGTTFAAGKPAAAGQDNWETF